MTSPRTSRQRPRRTIVFTAVVIDLAIWIAMAIAPVDRFD